MTKALGTKAHHLDSQASSQRRTGTQVPGRTRTDRPLNRGTRLPAMVRATRRAPCPVQLAAATRRRVDSPRVLETAGVPVHGYAEGQFPQFRRSSVRAAEAAQRALPAL